MAKGKNKAFRFSRRGFLGTVAGAPFLLAKGNESVRAEKELSHLPGWSMPGEPDLYPMYYSTLGRTPPEKFLKVPRVDYHAHMRDTARHPINHMMEVFDNAGISLVHDLDGYQGNVFKKRFEGCEKKWPERFVMAFIINYDGIDEPGWAEREVKALEEARASGATTVKEFKRLGLWVRDKNGRVAVDDPRISPIWEKAGKLGMPVTIHTADPEAFWLPVDERNERYEELKAHPYWSFAKGFPPRLTLLEERNRMIRSHPNTVFVGAHVGNNPENLDYVGECLDEMPNFHVDLAARFAEIVNTSDRYMAMGSSLSPMRNAGVGEVGPRMRSTSRNASSNSRAIRVLTLWAFP